MSNMKKAAAVIAATIGLAGAGAVTAMQSTAPSSRDIIAVERTPGVAQKVTVKQKKGLAKNYHGWTKPAKPKNQRQRRKKERQNPHLRCKN